MGQIGPKSTVPNGSIERSKKYANHNNNNNNHVYHPNSMVFSQFMKYRSIKKDTMYWSINTNSLHSN